jgi:transcriptional regulator GlxA family with amidase domain
MSLNIGIVMVEDFQLADAAGPIDLFTMAGSSEWASVGDAHPPEILQNAKVHWIGPSMEPFSATIGIKIAPTCTYATAPKLDILFVPGPNPRYVASDDTAEYIRRAAEESPIVMSVCTGSIVLAHLGILDGKQASVNIECLDVAQELYPKVQWQDRNRRWSVDGKFWTGGGVVDGMCMIVGFLNSGRFGAIDGMVDRAARLLAFEPKGQFRL